MGCKTMLIYVTKDDIKKGQRKSSSLCPIARSLKRRGFDDVAVGKFTVAFHSPFVRTDLPQEARTFVRNFDAGVRRDRLQPFRFRLEVPKGVR